MFCVWVLLIHLILFRHACYIRSVLCIFWGFSGHTQLRVLRHLSKWVLGIELVNWVQGKHPFSPRFTQIPGSLFFCFLSRREWRHQSLVGQCHGWAWSRSNLLPLSFLCAVGGGFTELGLPCAMAEADPLFVLYSLCGFSPPAIFSLCCCLRLLQIPVFGGQGEREPPTVLGSMKATLSAQVQHWSMWFPGWAPENPGNTRATPHLQMLLFKCPEPWWHQWPLKLSNLFSEKLMPFPWGK